MNVSLKLTQSDLPIIESTQIFIACFHGIPSPFPKTIHCDVPEDENCSNDDLRLDGIPRYYINGTVDAQGNVGTDGNVTRRTDTEITATDEYHDKRMVEVRTERNAKLSDCDFVVLSDSQATTACKTAFETYRQSLRDVPDAPEFDPDDFTWPTKPEYVKV